MKLRAERKSQKRTDTHAGSCPRWSDLRRSRRCSSRSVGRSSGPRTSRTRSRWRTGCARCTDRLPGSKRGAGCMNITATFPLLPFLNKQPWGQNINALVCWYASRDGKMKSGILWNVTWSPRVTKYCHRDILSGCRVHLSRFTAQVHQRERSLITFALKMRKVIYLFVCVFLA